MNFNTDSGLVLVVDDVPENLAVLHDALDESGFTVLVANNGESALQRAIEAQPHIILLDAIMPGMDGFETCRRLKANLATRHIPVVFMTGLTDTRHVVQGFEVGGSDYVTKPIQTDEVLARVAAHLRTSRILLSAREAQQPSVLTLEDAPAQRLLSARFQLTEREVEVLRWVACGKTNRDIGDILGLSPRTVNKHLEHVYVKLGVETRTAATSVALAAI